ncbi:Aminotransferase, class V/Cysteine desulfurase, partial [mine drainage metagenome]
MAFVKNTSEGLAFVANGLDWKAGDEIISTAVEYPSNVYPWMDVARRCGARHIMLPERDGRIDIQSIFDAATPRTRMIALSHVEYASGFR